ncbi:MAG TPA: hypothetical protein VES42_16290 [Pilimelia sp.]|nr:hypothetical protein [Pilimelia sp.]
MALQVVSQKVSVYKVLGVKDGQEQTEEHVFVRGQLLPEWVSAHQQFVLSQTGMARQVGDFPDPTLRRPQEEPAPVVLPEHSELGVLGTAVTEPATVVKRVEGADVRVGAATRPVGELPGENETKPVWEDFAVEGLPEGSRMSRPEAESMRKADLVKEVTARQQKAARAQAKQVQPGDDNLPRSFSPPSAPQPGGASSAAGGDATRGENAAKGGSAGKAGAK